MAKALAGGCEGSYNVVKQSKTTLSRSAYLCHVGTPSSCERATRRLVLCLGSYIQYSCRRDEAAATRLQSAQCQFALLNFGRIKRDVLNTQPSSDKSGHRLLRNSIAKVDPPSLRRKRVERTLTHPLHA
jgi:hypothetical protein